MKAYDVVILGPGIAGLSAAVALAKSRKNVLVLRKKGIKGDASPRAAGILDPVLEMDPGSPLLALSLKAFGSYHTFVRECTRNSPSSIDFAKTGMLYAALNRPETSVLQARYNWQRRTHLPVKWLDRKNILRNYPGISGQVQAGLLYPTILKVNPQKLMHALEKHAGRSGVHVMEYNGNISLKTKNNRVSEIRVGNRSLLCSAVINATGSWAGALTDKHLRLPIVPARGQLLVIKGKFQISTILHSLDGTYIVPWGKQKFLIGSTVEFAGYNSKILKSKSQDILRRADRLMPGIAAAKCIDSWVGLRPFAKDRLPVIGPGSVKGLYHAAGYFRSGILIGPLVGKLLAEGILSGRMPGILRAFDLCRFERKKRSNVKNHSRVRRKMALSVD